MRPVQGLIRQVFTHVLVCAFPTPTKSQMDEAAMLSRQVTKPLTLPLLLTLPLPP